MVPLTQQMGGMHAWKLVILRNGRGRKSGRTLVTSCCGGEVRLVPRWFGAAGDRPVEILSVVGRQAERIQVRPAPRGGSDDT